MARSRVEKSAVLYEVWQAAREQWEITRSHKDYRRVIQAQFRYRDVKSEESTTV